MERRTLLAFAVIFAFLIGWNLLFKPKVPPGGQRPGMFGSGRPQPPAGASAESSAARMGTPREPAGMAPVVGAAAGAAARDSLPTGRWTIASDRESAQGIRVTTDRFTAEIDPVGGDLLSWQLTGFKTADGHQVELVGRAALDHGSQRAHALRLVLGDSPVDLRTVAFEPSAPELHLDASRPQGDLTLRARSVAGDALELVYHFDNDRYEVGVEVSFVAAQVGEHRVFWEVSWPGGIAHSEPDSAAEYGTYKASARLGTDIYRRMLRDLSRGDGARGRGNFDGTLSWAGVQSRYFVALQLLSVPGAAPLPGTVAFDGDYARKLQTFKTRVPMAGNGPATVRYALYLGPLDYSHLAPIGSELGHLVELGPAAVRPVVHATRWLLQSLHRIIPNYGLVIIILSVAAKLLFYPLTRTSTVSMRKMQEMQPVLQKLKEKYKDDQQRQSQEMFALYKKHKINPMSGCWPILVQMPVFWALFTVLSRAIELRQAPFVGWINDLSRPDVLFHLPATLPILGDKFSLLPVLMAAAMWLQTKFSGMSSMPAGEGMMAAQTQMMNVMMPLVMFLAFYKSPSGLVLYWLVNTILTAWQTWQIHKSLGPRAAPAE